MFGSDKRDQELMRVAKPYLRGFERCYVRKCSFTKQRRMESSALYTSSAFVVH